MGRLTQEQVAFVETFVRCEGKLNRMERGGRILVPHAAGEVERGHSPDGLPGWIEAAITDEERHRVLDDLASGKITSEEAMRTLEGG